MNRGIETSKGRLITGKSFLAMLLSGILLLAGQGICFASTAVLKWDPSSDASVTGYKVYYQADSPSQPFTGTGAAQGAAPINVNNQTTTTISGLDPAHAYYFAVTAYNAAGVESPYSNIASITELLAPTTSLSSPANNATVSGTVAVTATASDNVGTSKVEFYVNGVLKATDTATPYVYSWNTASLTSGSYTLLAKAYDAAGNVGQSSAVSVSLVNDTTTPTVSMTAPGTNSTLSGTVTISATASDNVGVSKVEFYKDGALLYAGNVAPFSYSWNTMSVSNGSYSLLAKAYDNSGNIGQSSSVAVTVNNAVADTTAPLVNTFSMPATASSLTVPVTGLAAGDDMAVSGYMVTESAAAPAAGAAGWSASAPASFTFSAAGSKTAYAWAKDGAGNVSAAKSSSVVITLPDTTSALTINDALLALQIAVGKVQPTNGQKVRMDVAPYSNGSSHPDGKIDLGDVVVILGKVTGKIAL